MQTHSMSLGNASAQRTDRGLTTRIHAQDNNRTKRSGKFCQGKACCNCIAGLTTLDRAIRYSRTVVDGSRGRAQGLECVPTAETFAARIVQLLSIPEIQESVPFSLTQVGEEVHEILLIEPSLGNQAWRHRVCMNSNIPARRMSKKTRRNLNSVLLAVRLDPIRVLLCHHRPRVLAMELSDRHWRAGLSANDPVAARTWWRSIVAVRWSALVRPRRSHLPTIAPNFPSTL
jgi:hypothetical protein